VAPGQLVTLFGSGIGPDTGAFFPFFPGMDPHSGALFPFFPPVPTSLGDTQVFFNGVAAPVLFAQANQVNAICPSGVTAGIPPMANRLRTDVVVTVSVVKSSPYLPNRGTEADKPSLKLGRNAELFI
jgi:uncharacterized protein (TIGR03437 family)